MLDVLKIKARLWNKLFHSNGVPLSQWVKLPKKPSHNEVKQATEYQKAAQAHQGAKSGDVTGYNQVT